MYGREPDTVRAQGKDGCYKMDRESGKMDTINREMFADEKSRQIFDYRLQYYQTGDMECLLDMVVDEYRDFSRRIDNMKQKIYGKLRDFEGNFIIYGAGAHAGLAMEYLKRKNLDDRFMCYCVSRYDESMGGKAKVISEMEADKNKCMILVPNGHYAAEMIENLESMGWDSEHYLLLPYVLIFDYALDDEKDIENILKDRENHFIVYGTDWNSILFRSLMRGSNRHFDFSIAELEGKPLEDLSYVASMKNLYVVVFNGLRKKKAIEAGVPESKIIQLCNIDELQYFDEDVVPEHVKGTREVFVDGGSLDLCSTGQFMRWCNYECDKVIAYEPDKRCVKICEEVLAEMPKLGNLTELIPKGLWSSETELVFNEVANFGSSSFITHKGSGKEQVIPTTSVDIVLHGEPVTFIKDGYRRSRVRSTERNSKYYQKVPSYIGDIYIP